MPSCTTGGLPLGRLAAQRKHNTALELYSDGLLALVGLRKRRDDAGSRAKGNVATLGTHRCVRRIRRNATKIAAPAARTAVLDVSSMAGCREEGMQCGFC